MRFLIVVAFFALGLPDLPGLIRKRRPREIAAYAFAWGAGLTLSLLIAYNVRINGVILFLRRIFEPLGKLAITPPPV